MPLSYWMRSPFTGKMELKTLSEPVYPEIPKELVLHWGDNQTTMILDRIGVLQYPQTRWYKVKTPENGPWIPFQTKDVPLPSGAKRVDDTRTVIEWQSTYPVPSCLTSYFQQQLPCKLTDTSEKCIYDYGSTACWKRGASASFTTGIRVQDLDCTQISVGIDITYGTDASADFEYDSTHSQIRPHSCSFYVSPL